VAGKLRAVSFFDFGEEIERTRVDAISDHDRAALRTTIPQQRLPEAVRSAGWHFLDATSVFEPGAEPRELVVGVAAWNTAELRALSALAQWPGRDAFAIQVFDIDDCRNANDIERVLPGVDPPMQTPVVAEYSDGQLTRCAEGAEALSLLAELEDGASSSVTWPRGEGCLRFSSRRRHRQ